MLKKTLIVLITLGWAVLVSAQSLALKAGHPARYLVKKGDTLWDISGKFLQQPWHWPQLWRANPQVKNPHLIYPGDVLALQLIDGKPVLELIRGTVKLSPKMRSKKLASAISTIPYPVIKPFLVDHQVFSSVQFKLAPYVVALEEQRIIAAAGNKVYVRGLHAPYFKEYAIYRKGEKYVDPQTKEVLGYGALRVGDADLLKRGDPAAMRLQSSNGEIVVGDRVFQLQRQKPDLHFMPRSPSRNIDGQIIDVFGGMTQIGQYQVVVINRGMINGMRVGDVLAIRSERKAVADTVEKGPAVVIMGDKIGEMLVFRIFARVSFALVMRATKPIHTLDEVTNPS